LFDRSIVRVCVYSYYQFEKFAAYSKWFSFVPATAAFMIASTSDLDDTEDAATGCGINSEKRLIFIPINNSTDSRSVNAGNHWALLDFDANEQKFFYFDSAGKVSPIVSAPLSAVCFDLD
jgi:hypothetical protein